MHYFTEDHLLFFKKKKKSTSNNFKANLEHFFQYNGQLINGPCLRFSTKVLHYSMRSNPRIGAAWSPGETTVCDGVTSDWINSLSIRYALPTVDSMEQPCGTLLNYRGIHSPRPRFITLMMWVSTS